MKNIFLKILGIGLILGIGVQTTSCAKSPAPVTEPAPVAEAKKVEEPPKIDMAKELAKIDTMLIADTPSVTIAHESYLRALDMLEEDKIIFAELFLKRALAHDPESHFLLDELIRVLLRQNKGAEAFPLLKLAVQNPNATGDDYLFIARIYKENLTLNNSYLGIKFSFMLNIRQS